MQGGPQRFPFVGRREELALLHTELRRVVAGEPRVVAVEGGPGIGKSALLARFVEEAKLPLTLQASGAEAEATLAWGVLAQMTRGADAALGQRGVWPRPTGDADPLVVGAQLVDALGLLQQSGPLGIVLDDAGWTDPHSSQALLFALRRLEADRVLVALGLRGERLDRLGEPWRRILDSERATRLPLLGLRPSELVELAATGGIELSFSAARRLADHTGGSPLYARALLEELDPAALRRSEGPLPAPTSYSALVLARLGACHPDTGTLVAAAAVVGEKAPLFRVAEVAGATDLEAALSEAIRAGLLSESFGPAGTEVAFPHPLVRAAVYSDLGPGRRGELHRRAAAMVAPGASLAHRLAASLGPDPDLAAALEDLGRNELARGDVRSAGAHLLQAARVSAAGPDRHRLLLAGVEAHLAAGEIGAAEEVRSELVELPPSPMRSYLLGYLALWRARAAEAVDELRRAWALLGDPGRAPEIGVGVASQLAIWSTLAYSFEDALRWADDAVRLSEGAPGLLGGALAAWAIAYGVAGRGEAALQRLDTLGAAEDVPPEMLDALAARGMVRLWTDALDEARADLSVVLARARSGHLVRLLSQATAYLGETCYRSGALDEAIMHTELACVLADETGREWDRSFVHALATYPRAARGELSEAEAHAKAARANASVFGVAGALAYAASATASVAQARGDPAALAKAAAAYRIPPETGAFPVGPVQAEAMVEAGRFDAAEASLTAYETAARRLGRSSSLIASAQVRVALEAARGRMAAAEVAYEEGRSAATRTAQPLALARLQASYGAALAASGQHPRARRELTEAAVTFEALGAKPDLARTQAELAKVGGRYSVHPTPLTTKEAAVAQVVAEGLSNREAAARLVISVKTIEYHLGHVYDKLGVRTRAQLVAKLRSGPVPAARRGRAEATLGAGWALPPQ